MGKSRLRPTKDRLIAGIENSITSFKSQLANLPTDKLLAENIRRELETKGEEVYQKFIGANTTDARLAAASEITGWLNELKEARSEATQSFIDELDAIVLESGENTNAKDTVPIARFEPTTTPDDLDEIFRGLDEAAAIAAKSAEDDWPTDSESNNASPATPSRPSTPSRETRDEIATRLASAMRGEPSPSTTRGDPIIYTELPPLAADTNANPNIDASNVSRNGAKAVLEAMLRGRRTASPTTPPPTVSDDVAPIVEAATPPPPAPTRAAPTATPQAAETPPAAREPTTTPIATATAATPEPLEIYQKIEQYITTLPDEYKDQNRFPEVTRAINDFRATTTYGTTLSETDDNYEQLMQRFKENDRALRIAVNNAYFESDFQGADTLMASLQSLPDASTDPLTMAFLQKLNEIKTHVNNPDTVANELANHLMPQLISLTANMQTHYNGRSAAITAAPAAPAPAPAPAAPAPAPAAPAPAPAAPAPAPAAPAPAPAPAAPAPAARPDAAQRAQEDYNQCLQRLDELSKKISEKLQSENKSKFAGVLRPSTYANQELKIQLGREVALLQKLPYTPQIQRSVLGAKGNSFGNHEKTAKNLPEDIQGLLQQFHEEAQKALIIAAEQRNNYIASVGPIEPVIVSMERNQTLEEAYTAAKANIRELAAQDAGVAVHGSIAAGRADAISYSEKNLTDNQIRVHAVATELFEGKPRYAAFCETQKANVAHSTLMQLPDTLNPKAIWESVCVQAVKDKAVIKELKLPENLDHKIFLPVFAKIEKAMQEKPLSTSEIIDATKKAFKELGIGKPQIPNPNDTASRLATMFDMTRVNHMTITNDKGNIMPHPDLIKIAMQQLRNLNQMKPHEKEVNIDHASSIDYVYALKLCARQMDLTVNDRSPYKNHPEPTAKAYKQFEMYAFKHADELGIPKITRHGEKTAIKNMDKDADEPRRRPS